MLSCLPLGPHEVGVEWNGQTAQGDEVVWDVKDSNSNSIYNFIKFCKIYGMWKTELKNELKPALESWS